MQTRRWIFVVVVALAAVTGCVTTKQTDTARTGVEQLLLSTATDQALDKVDLSPIAHAKVFVDTQYLDCVDKNYVIVSLHQRLLNQDCKLVDKREDAEVVVEVGAGSMGTDHTEWFVGVPEIPLAMPSPISIPKLSVFTRSRAMGTAKLCVVAMDVKTHQAVINSGYSLARSDLKDWNVLGVNSAQTGSVPKAIKSATGESETITLPSNIAHKPTLTR
jgi:hypothetical protein